MCNLGVLSTMILSNMSYLERDLEYIEYLVHLFKIELKRMLDFLRLHECWFGVELVRCVRDNLHRLQLVGQRSLDFLHSKSSDGD